MFIIIENTHRHYLAYSSSPFPCLVCLACSQIFLMSMNDCKAVMLEVCTAPLGCCYNPQVACKLPSPGKVPCNARRRWHLSMNSGKSHFMSLKCCGSLTEVYRSCSGKNQIYTNLPLPSNVVCQRKHVCCPNFLHLIWFCTGATGLFACLLHDGNWWSSNVILNLG